MAGTGIVFLSLLFNLKNDLMKKTIVFLVMSMYIGNITAQTDPLNQTKPGTTVLNSTSNNSVSGVNPNGNPGTILYNNSNSSAVNYTLISPNKTVTTTIISTPNSSPIVTRDNVTVQAANPNAVKVISSSAINPNTTATTAVETRIDPQPGKQQNTTGQPIRTDENLTVVNITGNTETGLKPISNSPVLVNYIPEIIITKLKNTYADKLYDITMLKKSNNKSLYIVRVQGSTGYITYYLDENGNEIK